MLMGTMVNLTVVSDERKAAQAAAEAALERMSRLDSELSRWQPESQVSVLNRTGQLEAAGDDLLAIIELSRRVGRLSDGAFDITVLPLLELYKRHKEAGAGLPSDADLEKALELVDYRRLKVNGRRVHFEVPGMGITIDGAGKGYIVDEGVKQLQRAGFENVLLEAGGDLVAAGEKQPGQPWRIGIRSPRKESSGELVKLDLVDQALATSGDYQQAFTADYEHHHIIDPRTGRSSAELASCTLAAPTAAEADALATMAMVVGPDRTKQILQKLPGREAYLISKDLEVTKTPGLITV
jgi:thiamine biosynthesis lipoprotein